MMGRKNFYQELERMLNKFPKYHMNVLLGDLNAKKRQDINESLHEISSDNGVRVINFDTTKNLGVKSTMFLHRNIHKYNWTSPDGKAHNQINHILVDRGRHSNVLDIRSFRQQIVILTTIR
jgi:hypothetical protein